MDHNIRVWANRVATKISNYTPRLLLPLDTCLAPAIISVGIYLIDCKRTLNYFERCCIEKFSLFRAFIIAPNCILIYHYIIAKKIICKNNFLVSPKSFYPMLRTFPNPGFLFRSSTQVFVHLHAPQFTQRFEHKIM